jgi:branched-chain amino acid transport system substrate-binding protein
VEQALRNAGWPCTRKDFIAALEKTDLDTKGLTGGRIRYTSTDHSGPTMWRLYRWNDDKKALFPEMNWFEVTAQTMGIQ